jgi:ABC-type phosphate/phosphonate transport system substrate-binding protein
MSFASATGQTFGAETGTHEDGPGVAAPRFATAIPSPADIEQGKSPDPRRVVRIGAVGGSNAKTAMANLTTYLTRKGFPCDSVMYASYAALIDGLDRGDVEIAWNVPIAHAQYHIRHGCASQTLAMRETDVGLQLVLIAPADSKIQSPADLSGKRVILGRDRDQDGLLSAHFLKRAGADLDKVRIVRLPEQDAQGKRADTWTHLLQALAEGQGDAAVVPLSFWTASKSWQEEHPTYKAVWNSPSFNHCVFTAAKDFDTKLGNQFTRLMTTLDPNDPLVAELNRLEGTRKWLPGDSAGFESLIEALRQQGGKK